MNGQKIVEEAAAVCYNSGKQIERINKQIALCRAAFGGRAIIAEELMLKKYRTVAQFGEAEIVIEKSIFIGYAKPVGSEEEALAFIQEIKKKHRDATHNVPAYVLGEHNDIQRCNDDGEPSGTAGVPVLEVLKKEDVRDVAVVVTRYFGGIKLGTGGLVRAYTKGAKIALEAAKIITRVLYQTVIVTVDYTMLGALQNQLRLKQYDTKNVVYDEQVHLHVWVETEGVVDFKAQVTEWTNGRAVIEDGEISYRVV